MVEDERGLANDIAEGLRDHGMAVDIAYDGLDAAAKINLYPYDVLVLDRDLPGLHGDTICRQVADSENPTMVLMLTAADAPGERVAASRSAPTTIYPSRFIFPSLCSEFARWPRASPAPAPGSSAPPMSSSTRSNAWPHAPGASWTSAQRSWECWRRCCRQAPGR